METTKGNFWRNLWRGSFQEELSKENFLRFWTFWGKLVRGTFYRQPSGKKRNTLEGIFWEGPPGENFLRERSLRTFLWKLSVGKLSESQTVRYGLKSSVESEWWTFILVSIQSPLLITAHWSSFRNHPLSSLIRAVQMKLPWPLPLGVDPWPRLGQAKACHSTNQSDHVRGGQVTPDMQQNSFLGQFLSCWHKNTFFPLAFKLIEYDWPRTAKGHHVETASLGLRLIELK